MLAGLVGPIEGSRRIVHAWPALGDVDTPVVFPFREIEAISENLFIARNRSLWSPAFLNDMDQKYAACEASLQPMLSANCEALLAFLETLFRACAACGFSPVSDLPYDATGEQSYTSCVCCDYLPGVTDEIGYDAAAWRQRWISRGMPFHHPPTPLDWNPQEQLKRVFGSA
jgi:hypothetical protein